jgi:hypothetical protein
MDPFTIIAGKGPAWTFASEIDPASSAAAPPDPSNPT